VVESGFSSLAAAIEDAFDSRSILPKWPFGPLLIALTEQRLGVKVDQVDAVRDLATLSPRPVLIIHGTDDALFPSEHALRMYEAAQEPKALWLIEGLGHASPLISHPDEYRERVTTFFTEAFAR
jgi:fermentation-respiration switch protein FrsA (DUF1100 family)